MSEFLKRTLTGVALVSVMIFSILFHPVAALLLFATITLLSLNEFYLLMGHYTSVSHRWLHALAGSYLVVVSFLSAISVFNKWMLLPFFIYLFFVFIREIYNLSDATIQRTGIILLGQIYIAVPFALIAWAGFLRTAIYEPILLLAIFICIWMNDSGAYLIGSQIGKNKLFERISPKKSWEGFFGGVAVSVAASQVLAIYFPVLTHMQWAGFAIITSVSATYGDLFESFLKRSIGIKDSGNILPGHGGMLDRFDAPLFAIPSVMIYLYFFC